MRVTSARIDLSAHHALTESHTRREELTVTASPNSTTQGSNTVRTRERTLSPAGAIDNRPSLLDEELSRNPEFANLPDDGDTAVLNTALSQLSSIAGVALPNPAELKESLATMLADLSPNPTGLGLAGSQPIDTQIQPAEQLKMQLISAAVEAFYGRTFSLLDPATLDPAALDSSIFAEPPGAALPPDSAAGGQSAVEEPAPGPSLVYSYRDRHYERETTSFAATGVVHTADGQQIDIEVQLTMGRQFLSETSAEVRLGEVQDPLVVNFAGTAAELTERTFAFDLDTDGAAEQIHFVGPNSGFLAQDANGNGIVDDGSELFGPTSGRDFTELAAYDEDGNDFIDEGDSIYEGLRIWQKDPAGNDRLLALGQAGVGAIYLGSTATPFQVKNEDNVLQGIVRSSGIYLAENGGTGTVQQLDLVV